MMIQFFSKFGSLGIFNCFTILEIITQAYKLKGNEGVFPIRIRHLVEAKLQPTKHQNSRTINTITFLSNHNLNRFKCLCFSVILEFTHLNYKRMHIKSFLCEL